MTASARKPRNSSQTELSVIVVTYGARDQTLCCLHSLKKEFQRERWEVLIVDNGSANALVEEIASSFPEFRVLSQVANSGFGAAANLAASVSRGRYLLFLNPDTLVPAGAIDRLVAFARRRPEAGIWGGKTLFADGSVNPTSCRRRPTLWALFCSSLALDTRFPNSRLFAGMSYGSRVREGETPVDVVCGCFLLVEQSLWDRLAGFSPAFFMYGEDDDLCLRARLLGYQPLITSAAIIVHHGSGTESLQDRKLAQIFAARVLLIRAYFPPPVKPLALGLLTVRPWLGRRFAKRGLRKVWESVWDRRVQWRAGRFVS
jgi:hypothetical protein